MRLQGWLPLLGVLLAAVASARVAAADIAVVPIRVEARGEHARLEIGLAGGVAYSLSRVSNLEVLRFSRRTHFLGSRSQHAGSILSVQMMPDALALQLRPLSIVHASMVGSQLVLDVVAGGGSPDATPKQEEEPGTAAQAATAGPTSVIPGLPSPLVAVVDQPAARIEGQRTQAGSAAVGSRQEPAAPARSSPQMLQRIDTGSPIAVAASVVPPGAGFEGGVLLPYDVDVGAAAYRRGSLLVVVFDSDKPVDLSATGSDPRFSRASFSLLASGAVLTLPVPAAEDVAVRREPTGWLLSVSSATHQATTIEPRFGDGHIVLPALDPGHVVVVPDPVLGTDVLVGTVRQDAQNVALRRRAATYILDATLLGVAVERLSDQLELRSTSGSFVLTSPRGLDASDRAGHELLAGLSRSLNLPAVSDAELQRRYKAALASAALYPPTERRMSRLDAAEAALALGEGREAGDLASIADQDNPAGGDAARSALLGAAASLLTGDPDADLRLQGPKIANSDEVTLWRSLALAHRHPDSAEAARSIAKYLPLLTSYPEHLRGMLIGDAALSLVSAGTSDEAVLVRGLRGGGRVALAQAMLEMREGQTTVALDRLDRLAADADPAVALHATEEAVETRLKLGKLSLAQAARVLDAQFLNARMAGEELPLGLRVADLRAQQGDWGAALSTLRDIGLLYPGEIDRVKQSAAAILQKLAASDEAGRDIPPPAGAVKKLALLESNLDLLPADFSGTKILLNLASRLSQLDLPERAASLLRKAVSQAVPGSDRAALGLELARVSLQQNDVRGVASALDATDATDLLPDLVAARAVMRARASALSGDILGALKMLEPYHGADAEELRAEECAATQDWKNEVVALRSLVHLQTTSAGPLDGGGEDLILRLASAVVHAGDQDALASLAALWASRFPDKDKLDMLRLLTSSRVANTGDLARSASVLNDTRTALAAVGAASSKAGG